MINKVFYFSALISIIVILIIGTLFSYWMCWPDRPLEIYEPTAIPVDKMVYHPGDVISYSINYCKTRILPMKVYRSLVDTIITNYVPIDTDPPIGCHITYSNSIIVPQFTAPGVYHIEARIVAKLNPIRDFTADWRSVDFEIK